MLCKLVCADTKQQMELENWQEPLQQPSLDRMGKVWYSINTLFIWIPELGVQSVRRKQN